MSTTPPPPERPVLGRSPSVILGGRALEEGEPMPNLNLPPPACEEMKSFDELLIQLLMDKLHDTQNRVAALAAQVETQGRREADMLAVMHAQEARLAALEEAVHGPDTITDEEEWSGSSGDDELLNTPPTTLPATLHSSILRPL